VLGRDETGGEVPLLAVADWGLMFNVSAHDAIGASVFASADLGTFSLGPAVRYRRWIADSQSVEVAVGVPLLAPSNDYMATPWVFGLLKWSPNHWFAVAARPELVHQTVLVGCPPFAPTPCSSEVQSRVRLSLGVEVGEVPGAVLTGAAPVLAFLAFLVGYHGSN